MNTYPLSRNGVPGRDQAGIPQAGRHARPVSLPAAALQDVLRDRSLDRIRAAERAITDAQGRLRGMGADSDAVNGAFALVRDSLGEARETVSDARRELALVLHEWEQLNRRLREPGRYPDAAAPVVPDPPDENLCPDPGTAQTPAELMGTLRKYREWAGKPSFRAMEHVIRKQRGPHFAASTLHATLGSDALPSLQKVQAVITACGGSDAHQQMFTTAWRRLVLPRQDEPRPQRPRMLYPVCETA